MIDTITQYIISLVPAVTAVVGMVVTLGVGVAKIKKANKDATDEVKESHKQNVELRRELAEIARENKELKQSIKKITARMEHMYYVEEKEK